MIASAQRPRRAARAVVVAFATLACLLVAAGCGSDGSGGTGSSPSSSGASADSSGGPTGQVTVLAAASLTEAFTTIAQQVEAAHPGLDVELSFAGSSDLAQQIKAGAPADVFASADPAQMQVVDASGDVTHHRLFARNLLEIAVPPGNPGHVTGLSGFARPGLKTALCAPQVPCGAAARKALAAAGVDAKPDTLEQDVKAVLAKVTLGEVDAGLGYRTDVRAAGDKVHGIDFPAARTAVNDYPIGVLDDASNEAGAHAFVDAVLSSQGQAVLQNAGFEKP